MQIKLFAFCHRHKHVCTRAYMIVTIGTTTLNQLMTNARCHVARKEHKISQLRECSSIMAIKFVLFAKLLQLPGTYQNDNDDDDDDDYSKRKIQASIYLHEPI